MVFVSDLLVATMAFSNAFNGLHSAVENSFVQGLQWVMEKTQRLFPTLPMLWNKCFQWLFSTTLEGKGKMPRAF